jgi:glycosyltransferase involved in cell wall biosynthesis
MNILFLHQNMPGQFKHLAPALARQPGNRVMFLTRRRDIDLPGVQRVSYTPPRAAKDSTHHYLRDYEGCVLHGQQVVRACQQIARDGFTPDLVIAHPGWGESLFVKDVFPRATLLNYCEFYYSGSGADLGFDPETPIGLDEVCRARARNAHLLLSLESCDRGISPTDWQKRQHPEPLQSKISVIFDGVDSNRVRPNQNAGFTLPDGRVLTRQDEVVTYVVRNLEPYRGFPSFMRALPEILRRRPSAQILIVGQDGVSYGRPAPNGKTWRETMLAEVDLPDPARVHFLGQIPYGRFLTLLQVSSAHVYLTVPFVLSWSCIEALSAGCIVVGSKTPPVEEAIEDEQNGFLVDFFSPAEIADRVVHVLAHRRTLDLMRLRARLSVLGRYDLSQCLPRQLALINEMTGVQSDTDAANAMCLA